LTTSYGYRINNYPFVEWFNCSEREDDEFEGRDYQYDKGNQVWSRDYPGNY
jgi:hypothetical protein